MFGAKLSWCQIVHFLTLGAKLSGAKLSGAKLSGAKLSYNPAPLVAGFFPNL